MGKIKILLAEDDNNLGMLLKDYLETKNFNVVWTKNGKSAFDAFKKEEFNFLILDVMMPLKDGFTLAKEIRKIDTGIPIIFLTAKSLQEDKIKGFQSGADDYIVKPFSMEELIMRINAILRRSKPEETHTKKIFTVGKYTFDYENRTLIYNNYKIKLTTKETELLKLLCENINNITDRKSALIKVWGDDSYYNSRSMDVYITKLRKYLKNDPDIEIVNIHGQGYKLYIKK